MLLGKCIHASASGEVIRRLRTAMQHHDQRDSLSWRICIACRDVDLISARSRTIGVLAAGECAGTCWLESGGCVIPAVLRSVDLAGLSCDGASIRACRRQGLDGIGDACLLVRLPIESCRSKRSLNGVANCAHVNIAMRERCLRQRVLAQQASAQIVIDFQGGSFLRKKTSKNPVGKCAAHSGAGMKRAQHGDRLDGGASQRRRDVIRNPGQANHLDVQQLACSVRAFQIRAAEVLQAERQGAPADRLLHRIRMDRQLIANRRANKVGPI